MTPKQRFDAGHCFITGISGVVQKLIEEHGHYFIAKRVNGVWVYYQSMGCFYKEGFTYCLPALGTRFRYRYYSYKSLTFLDNDNS